MGRLIDVDEAIKDFEKYDSFMGEPLTERDAYLVKCVLAIFDSRPTAYDAEAVVRELEAEYEWSNETYNGTADMYYLGKALAYDKAIEIVRRGGRNEI